MSRFAFTTTSADGAERPPTMAVSENDAVAAASRLIAFMEPGSQFVCFRIPEEDAT